MPDKYFLIVLVADMLDAVIKYTLIARPRTNTTDPSKKKEKAILDKLIEKRKRKKQVYAVI
jgi:hypothetical protein